MSYTCKDHGEGIPCDGCVHNLFGPPPEELPTVQRMHPFGCNREERRAAMKAKKPGFSKAEQKAAWPQTGGEGREVDENLYNTVSRGSRDV